MSGTAYESRVRLPSGSSVLVRLEVDENDAYDDQGELAEVAQMVASTTLTVLQGNINRAREPREVIDPWRPIEPDPFLTTDVTGATQTRDSGDEIGPGEVPC